jgi:hypothetical protein
MLLPALAGSVGLALHAEAVIDIVHAPIPIQVLVQSPAETTADLQVICLFRSLPLNTLHGSLLEMNEKLKGLLDRVHKPELFRGELGETLLLAPPAGSFARKSCSSSGWEIRRPSHRNAWIWWVRSCIPTRRISAWRTLTPPRPSSMAASTNSPPGKSPSR